MTPPLYFNNESFKLILFARGRRRAVHELKARIDFEFSRALYVRVHTIRHSLPVLYDTI